MTETHAWPLTRFGDVAEFRNGLNFLSSESGSVVRMLGVSDFKDRESIGADYDFAAVTPARELSPDDFLKAGDLVFVRSNGSKSLVGRCIIYTGTDMQAAISGFTIRARIIGHSADPGYLSKVMQSSLFRAHLLEQGGGSSINNLSQAALAAFKFRCPPLPEQRKIAEILRIWDDAIDAHEGLRSRARCVNSSIAAASFASVHAGSGDLREGWNEWKLGDLFSERNETGDPSLPLLSVTQGNGVVTQESTGRKNSANADRSKYKLVLPEDVAYNTMRMWQGASGVVRTSGVISPAYTVVVPDVARVFPQFSAHLFKSPRMMFDFERYSQGLTSDTWNLKYPAFSKIRVNLPPLEQQRRIADVLDQLKQLESLHASAAEALRTQKRGLMQKLLTGQVRVDVAAETEPGGQADD